MDSRTRFVCWVMAAVWVVAGCGNKALDPTQVGRFRPTPAINVILDSLGVAEETPVAWDHAEEPRPSDVVAYQSDYVLGPGDTVGVGILELYAENQWVSNQYTIAESGKLSIPEVGVIQAAGMTETDLEERIKQILSPKILKNPSVSVALINSQGRRFTVIGDGVTRAGRFPIPRYDFRLTDALALSGGPRQFNVSNIYVSRGDSGVAKTQAKTSASARPAHPAPRSVYAQAQAAPSAPVSKTGFKGVYRPEQFDRDFNAERALLGMAGSSTYPFRTQPWQTSDQQTVVAASQVPVYPGSGEVVTPSSFELLGGQRSDSGSARSSSLAVRPTFPVRGPSPSQDPDLRAPSAEGQVDWVFEKGRWVPRAVDPATSPTIDPVEARPIRRPVEEVARPSSQSLDPSWTLPLAKTIQPLSPGARAAQGNAADRFGESGTQPVTPRASTSPVPSGPMVQVGAQTQLGASSPQIEWVFRDGRWVPIQVGQAQQTLPPAPTPSPTPVPSQPRTRDQAQVGAEPGASSPQIEWVFRDGRWVPIQSGQAQQTPTTAPTPTPTPTPAPSQPAARNQGQVAAEPKAMPGEAEWEEAVQSRLIRVPTDKLLAGDPRYNLVVKPGDTIHVPVDIVGECCIMGNVNRAGYINITGRLMTLKMAIAAAGGLGPLAWPKKCEVIRRIGENREEIVLVDLDKIASGEQPDFFVKPNDLINVGTHFTSRWRAVLRNSFRATYGFGFLYDRNFADADYGKGWPDLF